MRSPFAEKLSRALWLSLVCTVKPRPPERTPIVFDGDVTPRPPRRSTGVTFHPLTLWTHKARLHQTGCVDSLNIVLRFMPNTEWSDMGDKNEWIKIGLSHVRSYEALQAPRGTQTGLNGGVNIIQLWAVTFITKLNPNDWITWVKKSVQKLLHNAYKWWPCRPQNATTVTNSLWILFFISEKHAFLTNVCPT